MDGWRRIPKAFLKIGRQGAGQAGQGMIVSPWYKVFSMCNAHIYSLVV